jgi:energy-coupling factor transporter ATP-binding protein EcfA2
MRLVSIKFIEFEGSPQEWRLDDFTLGERNLLVGKNASGKTRTLNIINALALHFAGIYPPKLSAKYEVVFKDDVNTYVYKLHYEDESVLSESFSKNDETLMRRNEDGTGEIWAEQVDDGKFIDFQVSVDEIAVVGKRDKIQHSFLEVLIDWGDSLRYFLFGSTMGKDRLTILSEKAVKKLNERDPNNIGPMYRLAAEELGDTFTSVVINDMNSIGYNLESLSLMAPVSFKPKDEMSKVIVGFSAKESELNGFTDQLSMSQGMFRALAIIIHTTYLQMIRKPSCILIDDIGEGLDFERSCKLIDVIRQKSIDSNIQIVLSTNDRFVMNNVPLEEWAVIKRTGSVVNVVNSINSKEIFEEFKFTGLSNFSFLEMDFASGNPEEDASEE